MRLNKYLARSGIASRRKCDILIFEGKININGNIIQDYSYQVKKDDIVSYDNKIIEIKSPAVIYIFNKPSGVISTVNDPLKRKTILDYFSKDERLFPIGRLDRDTTGIILITNDGDIAHTLMHPKFRVKRKYVVSTKIPLLKSNIIEISKGIKLSNNDYVTANIRIIEKNNKNYFYDIDLYEGKNREIKRIFKHYKSKVITLHRYSYGGILLGNLKPGNKKMISVKQLKSKINNEYL